MCVIRRYRTVVSHCVQYRLEYPSYLSTSAFAMQTASRTQVSECARSHVLCPLGLNDLGYFLGFSGQPPPPLGQCTPPTKKRRPEGAFLNFWVHPHTPPHLVFVTQSQKLTWTRKTDVLLHWSKSGSQKPGYSDNKHTATHRGTTPVIYRGVFRPVSCRA